MSFYRETDGQITIFLKVKTNSKVLGPLGVIAGNPARLYWGLKSAPIDGLANKELLRNLADILEIAPSNLTLKLGQSSKFKIVTIEACKTARVLGILDTLIKDD